MAAVEEATTVTYEQLADIEREFDDVETEISKQRSSVLRHACARDPYLPPITSSKLGRFPG